MLTYQQTLDYLYRLEIERMDLKLERVAAALHLCDAPHLRFPTVHIAGTNGKGSTAAFLHAMLSAAGYRVGLFTSPHLLDFCERIRLGRRWITPAEVVYGVAALRSRIEPAHIHLTPFEMMTLLALSTFAQAQIDIAIVEVGLGGRLDATNVLMPLVSVITSIGLDHQAYLGSTLSDIAREKGGIIKPGVPVVIGRIDPASEEVLKQIAHTCHSQTYMLGREFAAEMRGDGALAYHGLSLCLTRLHLGLRGEFQQRNAAVALAVMELLSPSFPVTETQLCQGLRQVRWPGRLEVVCQRPLVVLDGAHNPQAIHTLLAELPLLLQGKRVKLLFAAMRDKDWRTMIHLLAPVVDNVVVTRVQQARAEDPALLQEAFAPLHTAQVIGEAQAACRYLMETATGEEAILVAGSLFLVGEVYPLFASTVMRADSSLMRRGEMS